MPQARLSNTSVDAIRDRYRASFANTFAPQFRYEQMPGAEERTAYAAEYAANHAGLPQGAIWDEMQDRLRSDAR